MKKIETVIIIESTPEAVWNVLLDFESYPQWNPFVKKIIGTTKPGSQLEVHLLLDKGKPMVMKPKVVDYDEGKQFSWLGHLFVKGLFDGHHMFLIEDLNNGTTKFTHKEAFSGVLAAPLLKLIGEKTRIGFTKMNEAIKQQVERTEFLNKAS